MENKIFYLQTSNMQTYGKPIATYDGVLAYVDDELRKVGQL